MQLENSKPGLSFLLIVLYIYIIYIYIYIYIYILLHHYVSINSRYLFTESFSCLWIDNTQTNCSNEPSDHQKTFLINCVDLLNSVDLLNITWAERELINQLAGNACGGRHRSKASI